MKKSLISNKKECYVCKTTYNLHCHHIFEGTGRRKLSDDDGCWVWLCAYHHNMSNEGVHFNKKLDLELKRRCELKWLLDDYDRCINDFIKRYTKNYLWEE